MTSLGKKRKADEISREEDVHRPYGTIHCLPIVQEAVFTANQTYSDALVTRTYGDVHYVDIGCRGRVITDGMIMHVGLQSTCTQIPHPLTVHGSVVGSTIDEAVRNFLSYCSQGSAGAHMTVVKSRPLDWKSSPYEGFTLTDVSPLVQSLLPRWRRRAALLCYSKQRQEPTPWQRLPTTVFSKILSLL